MDLVCIIFSDLELILGQRRLRNAQCWDVSAEILFCLVWVYCLGFLTLGWVSQGWSPDSGRGKPDSPLQQPLIMNFTLSPPPTGNKVILGVLQLSDLKNRGVGDRRRPVFLSQQQKALRQIGSTPQSCTPYSKSSWLTTLPCVRPSLCSNPLPRPDSRLGSRVNRTHYPKVAKNPEKPPEPAGPNFPTPRRLPLCLLLPPRKVD